MRAIEKTKPPLILQEIQRRIILQKRIVKECGIQQNEDWIQRIKQNQPILLKYQRMYQNRKKSDDKYYPFCEFILWRLNKWINV